MVPRKKGLYTLWIHIISEQWAECTARNTKLRKRKKAKKAGEKNEEKVRTSTPGIFGFGKYDYYKGCPKQPPKTTKKKKTGEKGNDSEDVSP